MDEHSAESQRGLARLAGALFLLHLVESIAHFSIFEQPLLLTGALGDISTYLREHGRHARFGVALDLALFTTGIGLAVTLHALLNGWGTRLSQFALGLVLMQASVAVAIELSSFAALALAGGAHAVPGLSPAEREGLLALVLSVRADGYGIAAFFFCLGFGLFCLLMLRARALPMGLAVFGVGAHGSMLVGTLANMLLPGAVDVLMLGSSLVALLAQLAIGIWLVVKSPRRTAGGAVMRRGVATGA